MTEEDECNGLEDEHTIEIPPAETKDDPTAAPIVIFFHWRRLGPETVVRVLPAFRNARIIAPRGGVTLRRGTTWFDNEHIGVAKPQSVTDAEDRFLFWLDRHLDPTVRPWLCGFSNGGAFAGHLLIRHPDRFSGSALLIGPLVLPPWPDYALRDKPVFYGRGDSDEVVQIEIFQASESYLGGASGSRATLRRYSMAHEILPEEVRDMGVWFAAERCSVH